MRCVTVLLFLSQGCELAPADVQGLEAVVEGITEFLSEKQKSKTLYGFKIHVWAKWSKF